MGPKLAAALVAAQAEMRGIAKDSTNPHFKNKYASLDTIIDGIRPTLAKHGLAIVQGAVASDDGKGISVTTYIVHESSEMFAAGVYVPLTKWDAQGAGGALTYGRRYGLSAALCLSTDEDDDGNAASRPQRAASQPRQARTPIPAAEAAPAPASPAGPILRVGGKPLDTLTNEELRKITKQHRGDPKYQRLVDACDELLNNRALGIAVRRDLNDDEAVAQMHADVAADEKELDKRFW